MKTKLLIVLVALIVTGCEDKNDALRRYAKERGIPVVEYTSPTTLWHQKTLDISNRSGVPLERVRALHAEEGRAADMQTILDAR